MPVRIVSQRFSHLQWRRLFKELRGRPGGFNPWISVVSEHTSPHVTSESQTRNTRDAGQDRQPKIQSSSVEKTLQRITGQIAYLVYDQFRVTGTDDSVENYTDLFTVSLRNDDIQEFDSK